MNILLAVDGSAYTKKMLAHLAAHAYLQGTLHLLESGIGWNRRSKDMRARNSSAVG